MARPTENVNKRFWKYVKKTKKCWEWIGSKIPQGYGQFTMNGKNLRAHRVSYQMHSGSIPDGFFVCHHCDNPGCVRPSHLFIGDPKANAYDMIMKCRRADTSGEKNGQAKITMNIAQSIRSEYFKNKEMNRYAEKEFSQSKISKKYGITQAMVGKIIRNEAWT